MAYPDDKETFRRVVNQELPDIPGDVLDENDQNLPADFLERLQDTFGYNIKMGFASVKDFFNDIIAKFATIKKVDMITLFQGGGGGLKNKNEFTYFGKYVELLETDDVFFQVFFHCRKYGSVKSTITFQIYRTGATISPSYEFILTEEMARIGIPLNWVYLNPLAGSANYRIKILQQEGQGYWEYLTFTMIKVSL